MPIYEYKCENGHIFDMMQKMADDPITECIECGAPVRKVLHPVGISFKGSGFYSTDYKSSKKTEPAKGANGDSGEKSETKSDSTEKSAPKSGSSESASGKSNKKD